MDLILKYFPNLSEIQVEQFAQLQSLYSEWNSQINVISRKDMDNFYERHVLHSLGIAKIIDFEPQTEILDVGTGGGFPGIPLAIMFPQTKFHLVDSIGKKIKVVNEVVGAIGLQNVTANHCRANEVVGKFDFVVCRAVIRLNKFIPWVHDKVSKQSRNTLPNGLLCLKGGELKEELEEIRFPSKCIDLSNFFAEAFFQTKKVVYVKIGNSGS